MKSQARAWQAVKAELIADARQLLVRALWVAAALTSALVWAIVGTHVS